MISYSTNMMGVASNRWYEENNIPFKIVKGKVSDYKEYTEHYYCGRIDISGSGEMFPPEFGIDVMPAAEWGNLNLFCDEYKTQEVVSYETFIEDFEKFLGRKVNWWKK